jgi:hypothetical protein
VTRAWTDPWAASSVRKSRVISAVLIRSRE